MRLLASRWWLILIMTTIVLGMDAFGAATFLTGVVVLVALAVMLILVVLVGRISREREWRTMGDEGLRQAAAAELERRLRRRRAAAAVDLEEDRAAERVRRRG